MVTLHCRHACRGRPCSVETSAPSGDVAVVGAWSASALSSVVGRSVGDHFQISNRSAHLSFCSRVPYIFSQESSDDPCRKFKLQTRPNLGGERDLRPPGFQVILLSELQQKPGLVDTKRKLDAQIVAKKNRQDATNGATLEVFPESVRVRSLGHQQPEARSGPNMLALAYLHADVGSKVACGDLEPRAFASGFARAC
eukprot:2401418-Rhodomonas_salina.3